MATTNYNLPLFDANQPADLVGTYNPAMTTIDTTLKSLSDSMAEGGGFNPVPTSDASLTTDNLKSLKVTSNGIVYLPSE